MIRPLLVNLACVLALAAAGWWLSRVSEPPPVDCTCRQLSDQPAAYAGRSVRVATEGTQPGPDGRTLVWRAFADAPPAVVVRFAGPVPSPVPASVVGACHAPVAGGPVRVEVR